MAVAGTEPRWFLGRDNSGHWYLVDASRRQDWEAWITLAEDDEASWQEPAFAKRLGGSPSQVEFTDPILPRGM